MKVSLGVHLYDGPRGGGTHVARLLAEGLRARGVDVTFDLFDRDIDIIVLYEPNRKLRSSAYDHKDIRKYLRGVNSNALVVHRINNTSRARDDESDAFNAYRIRANKAVADFTVFISEWVRREYSQSGMDVQPSVVIKNGSRRYGPTAPVWDMSKKCRIVTHHWSDHPNKGIGIYAQLDQLLTTAAYGERFEFTYVGRYPNTHTFTNTKLVEPLVGDALWAELARHDVYITAAQYEAAGMHHIEAALTGLPLLYLESGALPEYCAGFGIPFSSEDLETKLEMMLEGYSLMKENMHAYSNTDDVMCDAYYKLFQDLLAKREAYIAMRKKKKRFLGLF